MSKDNGTQLHPTTLLPTRRRRAVKRCDRSIRRALARYHCLILPKYVMIGTDTEASILIIPDRGPDAQLSTPLTPHEQERVDQCQRAIQKALRRDRCLILPQYVMIGTHTVPSVRILPRRS